MESKEIPSCKVCNSPLGPEQLEASRCSMCGAQIGTGTDVFGELPSDLQTPYQESIEDIGEDNQTAYEEDLPGADTDFQLGESVFDETATPIFDSEEFSGDDDRLTALEEGEDSDEAATIMLPESSGEDGGTEIELSLEGDIEGDDNASDTPPLSLHGVPEDGIDHTQAGNDSLTQFEDRPPTITPVAPADSDGMATVALDEKIRDLWQDAEGDVNSPTSTLRVDVSHLEGDSHLSVSQRPIAYPEAAPGDKADYRVQKFVAKGGMGRVYLAMQTSLGRVVALKTLSDELAKKERYRRKFFAEASVTGHLDHPNIVPIHDLGIRGDGVPFYSMKFVTGEPWSDSINDRDKQDNLSILMRVADAMAFAHSRKILHRDLKPENVMLGEYGEVLVVDWGLAIHLEKDRNFALGGTPLYMSPEMANHDVPLIDQRSDVYLLGAMLFEILEKKAPHASGARTATERLLVAAMNQILPHETSDELIDVALKAMSTNPSDRYANVLEFQDAIRECQRHTESRDRSQRAAEQLNEAKQSGENEAYARSVFAYRDAIDLWEENSVAREGLVDAQLAYAENALEQQDYSLGLSLLDPDELKHQEVYRKLEAAQKQEQSRGRLLKIARNTAIATTVAALGLLTTVYFQAASNAKQQRVLREAAEAETQRAVTAEAEVASTNKTLVSTNAELEDKKQKLDEKVEELNSTNETLNKTVNQLAVEKKNVIGERDEKERQRALADDLRKVAVAEEAKASHRAFVSLTALTSADVAVNDTDGALRRLEAIERDFPKNVDWEASRLRYLTHADFDRKVVAPNLVAGAAGAAGLQAFVVQQSGGSGLRFGRYDATTSSVQLGDPADTGFNTPRRVAVGPSGLTVVGGRVAAKGDPLLEIFRSAGSKTPERVGTVAGERAGEQVTAMAFSPSGKELAVAKHSAVGPVRVSLYLIKGSGQLAQRDDQEAYEMEGQGAFMDLAYSADGLRLAAAELGGAGPGESSVSVWSRSSVEGVFGEPQEFQEDCLCVAFSPTAGNLLVGGSSSGAVLFWKLAEDSSFARDPIRRLRHTSRVTDVSFSSSGESLVSAASSGVALVWDLNPTSETWNVRDMPPLQHSSSLASASWSPDDAALLTSSTDGQLKVWPLAEYYNVRRWEPSEAACTTVVASTQGNQLIVGDAAGYTRVIEVENEGNLQAGGVSAEFFAGHSASTIADAWSLAEQTILTLAFEQDGSASLCRWQQATGQVARTTVENFDANAVYSLSSNGRRLVIADASGVRLIDTTTGKGLAISEQLASAIAYLPNSELVLITETRGRAAVYSTKGDQLQRAAVKTIASGRDLYRLTTAGEEPNYTAYAAAKETGQVYRLAINQAGNEITSTELPSLQNKASRLSATTAGLVAVSGGALYQLSSEDQQWQALAQSGVSHARISGDGSILALTTDGELRVWRGSNSMAVRQVRGTRYSSVGSANVREALLIGRRDATAIVDQVSLAGPATASPVAASRPPVVLAFEGNNLTTLSVTSDGFARVWDSQSPAAPVDAQRIGPEGSTVIAAALSPDQTMAAAVVVAEDQISVRMAGGGDGWQRWKELLVPAGGQLTTRTSVALSDAQIVAWDARQGLVYRWRLEDGTAAQPRRIAKANPAASTLLPVAVNKRGMIGVAVDSRENQTPLLIVPADASQKVFPADIAKASITSLVFSDSGNRLLAGTSGGKVAVIDATIATVPTADGGTEQKPRGDQLTTFAEHQSAVLSLRFVPQSQTLLSSGARGEALLWPTVAGEPNGLKHNNGVATLSGANR